MGVPTKQASPLAAARLRRRFRGALLAATIVLTGRGASGPGGLSESILVDAKGGLFTLAGGRVTLVVPAGALSAPTTIGVADDPAMPGALPATGFKFTPDGLKFRVPVGLALRVDPLRVPAGVAESDLRLQRNETGKSETLVGSGADTTLHMVGGLIEGFSGYGAKAPPAAAAIKVTGNTGIGVCKSAPFSAQAIDAAGAPITGLAWRWFSSDPSKATVNGVGVVTGMAEGTATIFATAARQQSNGVTVTVTAGGAGSDVTTIVVQPASTQLKTGETESYEAQAEDCRGDPIDDQSFAWSSARPQVATIGPDGAALAVWASKPPAMTLISATADGIPSEPVPLYVVAPISQFPFRVDTFTIYHGTVDATIHESNPLIHLSRTTSIKAENVKFFNVIPLKATEELRFFRLSDATVKARSKGTIQGCTESFGPGQVSVHFGAGGDPQYGHIQFTLTSPSQGYVAPPTWTAWGGNVRIPGARTIQCQDAPPTSLDDPLLVTWWNVPKLQGVAAPKAVWWWDADYSPEAWEAYLAFWRGELPFSLVGTSVEIERAPPSYYRKTTYRWNLSVR